MQKGHQIPEWKYNPFQPGEIIEYCGERVQVITNEGCCGKVRLLDEDGEFSERSEERVFEWTVFGKDCRRVEAAPQ